MKVPKLPKMLKRSKFEKRIYVTQQGLGKYKWFEAEQNINKFAMAGEEVEVGVYELVETKRVTAKVEVK